MESFLIFFFHVDIANSLRDFLLLRERLERLEIHNLGPWNPRFDCKTQKHYGKRNSTRDKRLGHTNMLSFFKPKPVQKVP